MQIGIQQLGEADVVCEALILPVTEGTAVVPATIPSGTGRLLARQIGRTFRGKQNEIMVVPPRDDVKAELFVLVGLGKKDEVTREKVRQAGGKALSTLRDLGIRTVALSPSVLAELRVSPSDFAEGALMGLYVYDKYRSGEKKKPVEKMTILARPSRGLRADIDRVKTVCSAVCFARDLVNAPSNDMTPSAIARIAASLREKNLSLSVLNRKGAEKAGMGAFLSVASGSREEPRFIVIDYRGSRKSPVVLIGKSVTFDSGGLSLKPSEGMEKMKYDMAGGAAVLGVLKAAVEMRLPVRLMGILPATENLPGGSATKPGDVVRAITGKTIEIINTDAEGRLTLADAIGYATRLKPRAIIDIATLTGACSIAFGSDAIAMMGNDRDLLERFKRAGEETYERVWEMPLFEEYKEYLKSDVADIRNIGGKVGGLMTSASFLSHFAGETPWVHLDIAGTAWLEKDRPYTPKGATGVGTRLILQVVKELS